MNKTQIAKALREAVFAPNKQGPLKVIADVGNLDYYIRRAVESLTLSLTALTMDQRLAYLDTALSLTALAKVKIQEPCDFTLQNRGFCPGKDVIAATKKVFNKNQKEESPLDQEQGSRRTELWAEAHKTPDKDGTN